MDTNPKSDTAFKFFIVCCAIVAMTCGLMVAVSQYRQAAGWKQLGDQYDQLGGRVVTAAQASRLLATTTTTWTSGGASQGTTTMLYPGVDVDAWADLHEELLRSNLKRRPMANEANEAIKNLGNSIGVENR